MEIGKYLQTRQYAGLLLEESNKMALKILVLSATGNVGRPLVNKLVRLGEKVKAASRGGGNFEGAEGVRFNFDDSSTWEAAFADVDRLFLMLPMDYNDTRNVQHELIEFAAARQIKIVLQSIVEAGDNPHGEQEQIVHLLRQVEQRLIASGAPFVILRVGWFMDNLHMFWAADIKAGDLSLPAGDGKVAFIDVRDIADGAAAVLTSDIFNGATYSLTGPEALSYSDVAAILSQTIGHPVVYNPVSPSDYAPLAVSRGMAKEFAELLSELLIRAPGTAAAIATKDVERLTGRARTMLDYARDNAWRFKR